MKQKNVVQRKPLSKIPIVEMFWSIQGEPRSIGKPVLFIRTLGCNLCCKFCDTTYASRPKVNKSKEYSVKDIIQRIKKEKADMVVFTGGEPLLFKRQIQEVVKNLPKIDFEIETNATITPFTAKNAFFNVSPKLESSGNSKENRYKPEILKKFAKSKVIFKFVMSNDADWDEMEDIIRKNKIKKDSVWVMPEGANRKDFIKNTHYWIDIIIKHKYNYAPRVHILLWDKKRGV